MLSVTSKTRLQAALVVDLDPSFDFVMPFQCKKSAAHSELQLTLLQRNVRGNGHKTQFYLKRVWILRFSGIKKSSNLQIISLFTFTHIKEYHI